jgi:2-C-methyl-D-erythritol 2,4-cyclodiphosphate synthase
VDALLGANALGDIGTYFPSSDDRWKGVSSLTFLSHAVELVSEAGFVIGNVDGTVVLESPRLRKYLQSMRQTLASEMSLDTQSVSVKATTSDGLGFTGIGEGIGAIAIVTLRRPDG